jgi:hypothetical protein
MEGAEMAKELSYIFAPVIIIGITWKMGGFDEAVLLSLTIIMGILFYIEEQVRDMRKNDAKESPSGNVD